MEQARELTMEAFPTFCREQGLKCTAQRLAVFAAVRLSRRHPSVDETLQVVRRSIPTITRTSVYRILNEFASIGLLSRMDTLTAARYDTCRTPHTHFICVRCGDVTDYPLPAGLTLPDGLPHTVQHVELRVSGLCPRCARTRV